MKDESTARSPDPLTAEPPGHPTDLWDRICNLEPEAVRRAKQIFTRAALNLPPPTRELDPSPEDGDAPPGILTPLVKEWSGALAEEEPFPSVAQAASLLPELVGRPVPSHGGGGAPVGLAVRRDPRQLGRVGATHGPRRAAGRDDQRLVGAAPRVAASHGRRRCGGLSTRTAHGAAKGQGLNFLKL